MLNYLGTNTNPNQYRLSSNLCLLLAVAQRGIVTVASLEREKVFNNGMIVILTGLKDLVENNLLQETNEFYTVDSNGIILLANLGYLEREK